MSGKRFPKFRSGAHPPRESAHSQRGVHTGGRLVGRRYCATRPCPGRQHSVTARPETLGPTCSRAFNNGDMETIIAWYALRARLVPRAAYAGAYSKGENSPYLALWSYASPSSVTRYVLVAHNSCVLGVKPVGL